MLYLTVLRNLKNDPLLQKYFKYRDDETEESHADFLGELYAQGAQENFKTYMADKIICDENAFSIAAAKGEEISKYIVAAYRSDLGALQSLIDDDDAHPYYFKSRVSRAPLYTPWDGPNTIKLLKNYYAQNGYGMYIKNKAFRYENGSLSPIASTSDVQLSDLKDYGREKKLISDNIESFLKGLPYSDMLLYGERGTGKSSTVHAMLNRYCSEGLRIVELSKENMLFLPALESMLSENPLKFIVYIDDLSLSGGDERISSLKAALEGSMEGYSKNVMIVATSNRRHIVDEKFSSREDSVHSGDSMQEELSLSDRFGLSVLFTTTTKEQYLSIVNQLASDAALTTDREKLNALAEQWALRKGGRSPRRARQFIDLVIASEAKNIPIEF